MKNTKEIVIFIGPPGAGKGTLAHLCTNRMGWLQCSTGDLCRKHVVGGTEIGQEIDLLVKSGKLISDSLIIEMVEQWLVQEVGARSNIILDGFPRTIAQAQKLDLLLSKPVFAGFSISVIRMELDGETVVQRLMSRLICTNNDCCAVYSAADSLLQGQAGAVCVKCAAPLMRRNDDVEAVIRQRIAAYQVHAADLVTYYQHAGRKVYDLNVVQPVEKVFSQFVRLMDVETA